MIKIYNEDCLKTMARIPDNYIDLTVTSPPYDKLRTYNNELQWNETIWKAIIKDLFRVTKKGGVVVWVVNDMTVKGSETGTSFKQALYAKKCGFNLHDTMIYRILNPPPNSGLRYQQCFEFMYVWSKCTPKTANIQVRKRRNKCNDKRLYRKKNFVRDKNGNFKNSDYFVKEQVPKDNIFEYYVGGGNSTKDSIAFKHPAIFPEQLAHDHIISWSNENDLVYDPFTGSGTTAKMCKILKRNFIGSEKVKKYCEIAEKRLKSIDSVQVDLF